MWAMPESVCGDVRPDGRQTQRGGSLGHHNATEKEIVVPDAMLNARGLNSFSA
jgi:hypothetical protein